MATDDAALRAALRDRVFPALLADSPDTPRSEALRTLLRCVVAQMAAARGLHLDGAPALHPTLAALDFSAADPRLPGLLYADLVDERRSRGSYYTPSALARRVAGWVLCPPPHDPAGRSPPPLLANARGGRGHRADRGFAPLPSLWGKGQRAKLTRVGGMRLLDPAMGSGHFLLAAGDVIAARLRDGDSALSAADARRAALACLHGIERDPLAAELARLTLWLWAADPALTPADLGDRLLCGDALRDEGLLAGLNPPFDAVMGNPPYASVFTRAAAGDDPLPERYTTASGSYDLAVPFVQRAVELVREGGRVGLVLPNKLFAASYARPLRAWLAERVTVEVIADYSAAQPFAADVYPVALVLRREAPRPAAALSVVRAASVDADPVLVRRGAQADLRDVPGAVWSAALDPDWDVLRACLERSAPLGEIAELSAGLTVGEAYDLRPFVFDAPPGALLADAVQLITSGLIRRHGTLWGRRTARFLRCAYHRPALMLHTLSPRRREQAAAPKIVLSGLGLRPAAFYDRGLAQASVATVVIRRAAWPLGALCAVLNSAAAARLYHALFGGLALAGGYLRFGRRELALLPVPAAAGGDPRVGRLEALAAQIARADALAFGDLDAQIDALVWEMYGIAPSPAMPPQGGPLLPPPQRG